MVPPEYQDFCQVFSKARATSLPPHHTYDCLLLGTAPHWGTLYYLSEPERKAMDAYINDSLAAGLIRPSSSPVSGFFSSSARRMEH